MEFIKATSEQQPISEIETIVNDLKLLGFELTGSCPDALRFENSQGEQLNVFYDFETEQYEII